MSMLLSICNNISALATKIGAAIKTNASPFVGGRNAICKTIQAPAGAAIWKLQTCPRQSDGSTPADGNTGWTDAAAFTAAAGLPAPVNDTFTQAGTGGSLVHSTTYYYRVSAYNAYGETLPSTETSLAMAANGSADTLVCTVKWLAVAGATGYKVYGRTTGAETLLATITDPTVLLFADTGAVTPSGAMPTVNTTAAPLTEEVTLDYWCRYNITNLGTGELSMILEGVQ